MFDGKFVATLAALAVAVLAIVKLDSKNKVTSYETFWGNPARTWKMEGETVNKEGIATSMRGNYMRKQDQQLAEISENYHTPPGQTHGVQVGETFQVPGHYQSMLSPRNSGAVGFGSAINYNPPSIEHMAVPPEPLDWGLMAREDYREDYGGCCGTSQSCGKGGSPDAVYAGPPLMAANFASGDYNEETAKARGEMYPETSSLIPVGDMTTLNSSGETVQPVMFDRFVFANRNSRLRSQGDMIRGDLPIVPCENGWFRPSVTPNIDLQQGAMNVMGGVTNETTQAMSRLISGTSADFTVAGVNLKDIPQDPTIAALSEGETTQALSTLNITAFP